MHHIVVPFKYKSKEGSIKELSFFIVKHQPIDLYFGGVNIKALVEDFDSPADDLDTTILNGKEKK